MTVQPTPSQIRVFSYGGGVQSTAALVLAAEGRIDYRTFLFANVGEDSEFPGTLRYLDRVAMPFAREAGLELTELRRTRRDGRTETLVERIESSPRSIPIPVRMGSAGAPGNRTCTADFKIRVIERELRRRGATRESPALVGIGISTDEPGRVGGEIDPRGPVQLRRYPLFELGLSRADCQTTIRAAGLPLPPRSACWFCPFHSSEEWRRLARREPELFARACELEEEMHERGELLGGVEVYFTRHGVSLRSLYRADEMTLFEEDDPLGLEAGCDSGHCMT